MSSVSDLSWYSRDSDPQSDGWAHAESNAWPYRENPDVKTRLSLISLLVALQPLGCGGCSDDENPLLGDVVVETCDNGIDDTGDGWVDCEDPRCQITRACEFEPPDPASVAPPFEAGKLTNFPDSIRFLWSGDNPVVRGVKPGAIDESRVSVLRGRLVDRDGNPVKGVAARIAGQPELGYTYSREDGAIDLVANGDSSATVRVQAAGFLAVDRTVETPVLDYQPVDEVVLTSLDERVTRLSGGGVAEGTPSVDQDGERQGRLWFPPGTVATVHLPDGQSAELRDFDVRLTEYTVGDTGPAAMPAFLPEQSAYTYAVELSIDEAEAVGAEEVTFNQTAYIYLDNFLNFDVGQAVPNGYYNRRLRRWEPVEDGRVMAVVEGGIDTDGSGEPATAQALEAEGLSSDEARAIRNLFDVGETFWRAPITHFSPYDLNWPFELPEDAVPPDDIPEPGTNEEDPCSETGSVIECQNQVLMKSVPVAGSAFNLVYRSDRVEGRGRAFDLELTRDTYPDSLKKILLHIDVLGRRIEREFEPQPNLTFSYEWDRRDAYGRDYNAKAPIRIAVGFVYEAQFTEPLVAGSSFGSPGGVALRPSRVDVPIWSRYRGYLGAFDSKQAANMGGWTLDVDQRYDATRQLLFPANAPERGGDDVSRIIRNFETFGGTYDVPIDLRNALVPNLGLLRGQDDSLYLPILPQGSAGTVVVRRHPNGNLTHIAGRHIDFEELQASGCHLDQNCGEGGPATEAILTGARWAIGPDDSLYVASGRCLRRIQDDVVTIIAGQHCLAGEEPDGQINFPNIDGIAIGPQSQIYVTNGTRIVQLFAGEKRIELVAGCQNCDAEFNEGSAPAVGTKVRVEAMTTTSDGAIWFFNSGRTLVRLDSGRLQAIDSNQDRDVRWAASGPDDAIYSFELNAQVQMQLIRYKDGGATTLGGLSTDPRDPSNPVDLESLYDANNVPATSAFLFPLGTPAITRDGRVYFATLWEVDEDLPGGDDEIELVIKEISSAYPTDLNQDESLISSRDGRRLHRFDRFGRSLSVSSALTGLELLSLRHGPDGLESIVDENGNQTRVERGPDGAPTAIVSPWGQRTELALDSNGFIESFSYPDGSSRRANYDAFGLLEQWEDGAGHLSAYSYDRMGNLIRAEDPRGGWKTLTRKRNGVVLETSSGRTVDYTKSAQQFYGSTWITTDEAGLEWRTELRFGGRKQLTEPNGTVRTTEKASHPRFGLQSPYIKERRTLTPSGLEQITRRSKTVELSDASNFSTLERMVESVDINEARTVFEFDAGARTLTRTSPEGRVVRFEFDSRNRNSVIQYGSFAPLEIGYDDAGHPHSYTQAESTLSGAFDSNGHLIEVTAPDGATAQIERDPLGRITRVTTPAGRVQDYDYDGVGHPIRVSTGANSDFQQSFNAYGRIESFELPSGDADTLEWNEDRDLQAVQRANGTWLTSRYDDARRVVGWSSQRGEFNRIYDESTGQVIESTSPEGQLNLSWDGFLITDRTIAFEGQSHSISNQYDDHFRVISRTLSGQTIQHDYDRDGLPTQVGELALTLDPEVPLITHMAIGNLTSDYDWDSRGRPSGESHFYGGDTLFSFTHTFDIASRVEQTAETVEGTTTTLQYTYDEDGQLLTVRRDGVLQAQFEYDNRGNRTSLVGGTATFDASNRIESASGRTYQTDESGFVVGWDGPSTVSLEYDGNDLISASVGPTQIVYGYDSIGRRIWKRVDGAFSRGWIYGDGVRPLAEVDETGTIVSRFIYASSNTVPEYMVRDGQTYRLIADAVGSIRLVVDVATGQVVQRIDYDPLGAILNDSNPGFQPFGFGSGLYDPHTELTRFGARDYDAVSGRWTAPDPLRFGGSLNLYVHCENDPVNRVDPRGEVAWAFLGKGLAVAGVLTSPLWTAAAQWRLFYEDKSNARAQEIASRLGLGRIDAENAMRHCVGQCTYSKLWTKWGARAAGSWHENPSIPKDFGGGGKQNLPGNVDYWDRLKDEHNNVCGRLNSDKEDDCLDACAADLENGVLATDVSSSTMVSQDPLFTPAPTMTLP